MTRAVLDFGGLESSGHAILPKLGVTQVNLAKQVDELAEMNFF